MVNGFTSQGKAVAASYLVGERLIRLVIGFFIHAWMARSLTPEDFGFISYVVKAVAVYYTFGLFGNDEMIIKELITRDKEGQKDVLKTVSWLRFFVGSIGLILMLGITGFVSGLGSETWIWMLLFGLTIPLQSLTVYELPFIANMAMKPIFHARNGSYFVGVAGKVLALFRYWDKSKFIMIYAVEEICWKFFITILAFKNGWGGGYYKREIAAVIWKPGILTFLAAFIMLFDQRLPFLLLDKIGNDVSLGQYAVVVALLDIALLLPISLATALFPSVVQGKQKSTESYQENRQALANWLIWFGLAFSFGVLLTAPWIIKLLYGGKYLEVTPILRGLAFTTIWSFFNIGRFKWFVLEDSLSDWIMLLVLGLTIQAVSLYLLIPKFGLEGIVLSVILGQVLPNLILIGRKSVRESLFIFMKAFRFWRIREFRR